MLTVITANQVSAKRQDDVTCFVFMLHVFHCMICFTVLQFLFSA